MNGDEINGLSSMPQDNEVPIRVISIHVDNLNRGVESFHKGGKLTESFRIILSTAVSYLPWAIDFTSNAPVFHSMGREVAKLFLHSDIFRWSVTIAALKPVEGFIQSPCAQAHGKIRFYPDFPAVLDELVGPEGIALSTSPGVI